jgi:hypothetical protein
MTPLWLSSSIVVSTLGLWWLAFELGLRVNLCW